MFSKRILFGSLAFLSGTFYTHLSQALECSASTDDWGSGYVVNVTVTNNASSAISSWSVRLTHSANPNVTGSWNANIGTQGSQVTASNVSWNGSLAAGQSTSFGYQGSHSGNFQVPTCSGDGGGVNPTSTPTNVPTPTPTNTTPTPTNAPTPTSGPNPTPNPGANLVIQENQSGFCGVEGTIDSNNTGYTGSGFANTDNAIGKGIDWSVNVASGGNYDLQWRYANGSGSNRSGGVIVNGNEQATVDLNGTGSWTTWQDSAAVTVYLSAGSNTIRLNANTSGGLPNVDKITLIGGGVTPGNCSGGPAPTPTPTSGPTPPPTPTPTQGPTPIPGNGNCPFELVGWATTNGGTTGGGNAAPTVVSNASQLRSALSGSTPRVVHFSGTIDTGGSSVSIGSNKTLRGTNKNAKISGGLTVNGQNVIVQNFTVHGKGYGGSPADAINGSGNNIWFDHLNVLEGGDGLLDLVNGADLITTSWNKFWYTDSGHGHRLSLLFGNSSDKCSLDGGKQRHTVHHNWFADLIRSRMPRLYFGKAHIFNNYYNSPGNNYAIGIGTWASALIENNYFQDVNNPHRLQNNYPSFIEASGNIYDNTSGSRATGATGIGTLPSRFAGSSCHANLADPGPWNPPYNYSLDSAASVPDLVKRCAGPQ